MGAHWPPSYDETYIPSPDAEYWNAQVETMDPQEREQTIILPKLKEQLKYTYNNSAFYKGKWDEAGVNPSDIRSLDDFEGFPMMIPITFSLCFGALCGDIIESFFKRRIGKNRGENWIILDQLDFILGALMFSFLMSCLLQIFGLLTDNWFIKTLFPWHILVLIIATPFFHFFA